MTNDNKNTIITIFTDKSIPCQKICLARRIIKDKTRYYDKYFFPQEIDECEYRFDMGELSNYSFCGKEYILDLIIKDARFVDASLQYANKNNIEVNPLDLRIDKNSLKISYVLRQKRTAKLIEFKEQGGEITLSLNINFTFDSCELWAYRRTISNRDFVYDKKTALTIKNMCLNPNDHLLELTLDSSLLLKNYCENAKEIWDIVIVNKSDVHPVFIETGDFKCEYMPNDKDIIYKLFNSEGYLSIWTRYNQFVGRLRKNIAILGSCYTKEAFHSLDFTNPDYKRFFNNVLTGFHHSLISLCSKSANEDYKINGPNAREIELYSRYELRKTFFDELASMHVDYLLVDNYADATLSICKDLNNNCYYTKNYYLQNSNFFSELKNTKDFSQHETERLLMYENAVKLFREKVVACNIPLSHILLIRSRQSLYKEKQDGGAELWPDHDFYEKSNVVWEWLDNIFLSIIPEARQIDMRNKKWISVENTPLKCTPNHFQTEYYQELMHKVNKIVLFNLLNNE